MCQKIKEGIRVIYGVVQRFLNKFKLNKTLRAIKSNPSLIKSNTGLLKVESSNTDEVEIEILGVELYNFFSRIISKAEGAKGLTSIQWMRGIKLLYKKHQETEINTDIAVGNFDGSINRLSYILRLNYFASAVYRKSEEHFFAALNEYDIDRLEKKTIFSCRKIDIITAKWKPLTHEPAYVVLHDHQTHHIIVSIRGTSSIADALTDLDVAAIPFLGSYAPAGIVKAVKTIKLEIFDHLICALDNLLLLKNQLLLDSSSSSYSIVMTGHSLGAAVASMLALYLRNEASKLVKLHYNHHQQHVLLQTTGNNNNLVQSSSPVLLNNNTRTSIIMQLLSNTTAVVFGSPPVMSEALSDRSAGAVLCVVNCHDFITRSSERSLAHLTEEVVKEMELYEEIEVKRKFAAQKMMFNPSSSSMNQFVSNQGLRSKGKLVKLSASLFNEYFGSRNNSRTTITITPPPSHTTTLSPPSVIVASYRLPSDDGVRSSKVVNDYNDNYNHSNNNEALRYHVRFLLPATILHITRHYNYNSSYAADIRRKGCYRIAYRKRECFERLTLSKTMVEDHKNMNYIQALQEIILSLYRENNDNTRDNTK